MDCTGRFLFFILSFSLFPSFSISALSKLNHGSSLSVENSKDVLISQDGGFSAGFYQVGINAYCFSIWYSNSNRTIIWMASRDQPVNGKRSRLTLKKEGNLVLTDAEEFIAWSTNTVSNESIVLRLLNNGNLVLKKDLGNNILWQSFDFPTDTLVPGQILKADMKLLSSRSRYNFSSGFYSMFFDNDNVIKLLYKGPETSSIYWPDTWLSPWQAGRTTYNSSRVASLDRSGYFDSSDLLNFKSSDLGFGINRRLTLDYDGNVRLYSLKEGIWSISWVAIAESCKVHGLCGPYGLCLSGKQGRQCSCLPGFKVKDPSDWSKGCEPTFNASCNSEKSMFVKLSKVDFFGYDFNYTDKTTFEECKNRCLQLCSCKGFMYPIEGNGQCYPKTLLLNGRQTASSREIFYLKLPLNFSGSRENRLQKLELNCRNKSPIELRRNYIVKSDKDSKYLLFVVACVILGVEIIFIGGGWWFLFRKKSSSNPINEGYFLAGAGFKRFTYEELKNATHNFKEEIGRGGEGTVYKGVLPSGKMAAVKKLTGLSHGESDFLAEISIIGKINHMNLIQMFGFCAQGKHKLLVYEYMEHGSLAKNLRNPDLGWKKMYEIAVGTAKGLAYLHEECLEWVLHCDVKPENILLDSDYQPKVSDFGLSKLLDRNNDNSKFSRIRGTRGYVAPEWILNLPITSKVDVYSYGMVVLDMVTAKLSTGSDDGVSDRLIPWIKEKMRSDSIDIVIQETIGPDIDSECDRVMIARLMKVSLQCVEEETDARPTMSQVVEMLSRHENDL